MGDNRVMKSKYKLISVIAICLFVIGYMMTNNNIISVASEKTEIGEATTTEETGQSTEQSEENSAEESLQQDKPVYSEQAIVEVSGYKLDQGILAAGKEISLILSLHNLSSTNAAESVMLTISSESGMIYPSYGNDNQFFVGTIPANESVEVTVPITVSSSFKQDYVDLKCGLSYVSKDNQMSNNSVLIITTSGGKRMLVNSLDVSTHAIVNGKSLISISLSNKSNSNIDDAKLIIEGNVSDESKEINLGTVNSGKNYSKDLDVTYTQIGNQSIIIKLAYTDGQGEHIETTLGKYNVSVSEQLAFENQENEKFKSLLVWGGRALALVFSLIALRVILSYIKKR